MAINYPEHCKGITAGALREAVKNGATTAGRSGGHMTKTALMNMMLSTHGYTNKREPLGKFMSDLSEAKARIDMTTEAVSASARRMVGEAEQAAASLAQASRSMREATDKMGAQMQKFHSIFASAKFDEQAKAACALVDAMERLAALEQKGLLSKVMEALRK